MIGKPPPENDRQDIEVNRDVAAFSYFLILSPVILFTRRDSPFIQFHARQACVLFVLLIIIAQLPGKLSYLNFLTLALAITGIFQANLGNRWKVPIVSHVIEAGFSADLFWRYLVRSFDTIRRSFVRAERLPPLQKEAKEALRHARTGDLYPLQALIAKEQYARKTQESRLIHLESEFIIQRFLIGKRVAELSEGNRSKLEEFMQKLSPLYVASQAKSENEWARILTGKKDMPQLLLGGFTEDSFIVFLLAPFEHADLTFGQYGGKTLSFTDEKAQEKFLREVHKLAKSETTVEPDFPASGLA